MDVKNAQGRTVSLLNDELPRLSNLTSLSNPKPSSHHFRPSLPQLQHHSSSSSTSTRSSDASSNPYSPRSNPPSLSRSDSSDSGAGQTPSPVTPLSTGFDTLRDLRQTLPRKYSSTLEGLPSLSSLRLQAKIPPSRSPMDFNGQQLPNDFSFASSTAQQLYDPLVAPQLAPVTSIGLEHLPQQTILTQPLPPQAPAQGVFPTPITAPKPSTKKNQYPCPLSKQYSCGEFFTTSGHAARHAKKHTGKKDAICPECGKGFTRKDNMEQHRRTHSGGRNKSTGSLSESSSSGKPVPSKDSEETKARQKARQQQRKSRPASISTTAQPPAPPQPPPQQQHPLSMQQQLPMTTMTTTLPPQGDMLDPALREQNNLNGFFPPTTDLNMGFGFPMTAGQMMQGFPAPQAPMSLMSTSRGRSSSSPQGLAPQAMNPVSPSAAPLASGMDKLDILAEASSRRSSE